MAFSISYIYEIRDRYSRALQRISSTTDRFARSMEANQRRAQQLGATLSKMGSRMDSVGQSISTRFTLAAGAAATFALKTAAHMETAEMQFEVMLGSADKSKKMMSDLVEFTKKTPFEFQGVTDATKVLLAFGSTADQIPHRLKVLGNISAGTGKNLKELAVIFGQIEGAGRLMGQDALQLVNAGIPIYDELAKVISTKTGRSFVDLKKNMKKFIEEGRIGFPLVMQAMEAMQAKGGRFNNMMDRLSQTMAGKWSNLMDEIKMTAKDVGQWLIDKFDLKSKLQRVIDAVAKFRDTFKQFTDNNPGLAKFIVLAGGALAVLGPLLVILGPIVKVVGFLFSGLGAVSLVVIKVVAVVGILIAMFRRWQNTNHPVLKSINRLLEALSPLKYVIGFIIDRLGALITWLTGTKNEAGALSHVFDAIGLALIPIIDGITALIQLMTGDSEGAAGTWQGMLDRLNEFREGLSMIAQIYDGMVTRITDWLVAVDNWFANITNKIKRFVEEVKTAAGFLARSGMFGGLVADITKKIGEDTAKTAAQNKGAASNNITGHITVGAEKGATVRSATIGLDQGNNLATVVQ